MKTLLWAGVLLVATAPAVSAQVQTPPARPGTDSGRMAPRSRTSEYPISPGTLTDSTRLPDRTTPLSQPGQQPSAPSGTQQR